MVTKRFFSPSDKEEHRKYVSKKHNFVYPFNCEFSFPNCTLLRLDRREPPALYHRSHDFNLINLNKLNYQREILHKTHYFHRHFDRFSFCTLINNIGAQFTVIKKESTRGDLNRSAVKHRMTWNGDLLLHRGKGKAASERKMNQRPPPPQVLAFIIHKVPSPPVNDDKEEEEELYSLDSSASAIIYFVH